MSIRRKFLAGLVVLTVLAANFHSLKAAGDTPTPREQVREKLRNRVRDARKPAESAKSDSLTNLTVGTSRHGMTHAGRERSYLLHVPKDLPAKTAVPLVIVLHGFGADGAITEPLTGFSPVADKEKFLVAYPDGLDRMWRFWEGGEKPNAPRLPKNSPDDAGFLLALIDSLVTAGHVDPRRVYLTGISNGGFMTNRMGILHPDRFAAIAPVAGSLVKQMANDALATRPLPVIIFHGTDDKIVGHDGSTFFSKQQLSLSSDELAAWWAKRAGCGQLKSETLADAKADGTTVRKHLYPAGPAGVEVVHFEIKGGGHTWPGGSNLQPEALLGKTTFDIHASELMWDFFKKYQSPTK